MPQSVVSNNPKKETHDQFRRSYVKRLYFFSSSPKKKWEYNIVVTRLTSNVKICRKVIFINNCKIYQNIFKILNHDKRHNVIHCIYTFNCAILCIFL